MTVNEMEAAIRLLQERQAEAGRSAHRWAVFWAFAGVAVTLMWLADVCYGP